MRPIIQCKLNGSSLLLGICRVKYSFAFSLTVTDALK